MTNNVLLAVTSRDGRLPWEVHQRMMAACRYALERGVQAQFYLHVNPYGVHLGRNEVVRYFLDGEWTHLLFVDDDVLLHPDAIAGLLKCSSSVAGGVYPYRRSGDGEVQLVLSAKVSGEWQSTHFDSIEQADCVGGGCMLIHRDLFCRVGFPWFRWPQWLDEDGVLRQHSDDLDFCLRADKAGGLVRVNGNVRCGHLKEVDLSEQIGEASHACP